MLKPKSYRRLRESEVPEFQDATCLAIACPACMTIELARSCGSYVTTIVNGADIIPTISPGGGLLNPKSPISCSACGIESLGVPTDRIQIRQGEICLDVWRAGYRASA